MDDREVLLEVRCTVRELSEVADRVGWQCRIKAVARSGRSVYLDVTNGQSRFRLRVSDHPSRFYKVTPKARQVLITRPGTLDAMIRWFRSRSKRAAGRSPA